MTDDDDEYEEETTGDIVRPILIPELDDEGLIVQPDEDSPEQRLREEHNRIRAANKGNYADPWTGNTHTHDPAGNYPCGECNMADDGECLLVDIDAIDERAGSCGKWERICAGDPEMLNKVVSLELAGYAIAANGNGFGCKRCPFASDSKVGADDMGRDLWCGIWGARVLSTGCCDENGAETVPIDDRGNPT